MQRIEEELIRLRFIIGYLGEQIKPAWWNSSFFASGSTMFLLPAFPKTVTLAQYHGIQEAASRLHDERIGKGANVFHLFRLPEATEHQLHQLVSEEHNKIDFTRDLTSIDNAIKALLSFADRKTVSGVGPVKIGNRSDLENRDSWQIVAQYYHQAFETENQIFPYFLEE